MSIHLSVTPGELGLGPGMAACDNNLLELQATTYSLEERSRRKLTRSTANGIGQAIGVGEAGRTKARRQTAVLIQIQRAATPPWPPCHACTSPITEWPSACRAACRLVAALPASARPLSSAVDRERRATVPVARPRLTCGGDPHPNPVHPWYRTRGMLCALLC